MQKLGLYSVKDIASDTYGAPFTAVNDSVAVRTFTTARHDENSNVHLYPEQFLLFKVGEFDDSTGVIEPCDVVCVVKAIDL